MVGYVVCVIMFGASGLQIAVMVTQSVLLGFLTELFADSKRCDAPPGNSTDVLQERSVSINAYFYGIGKRCCSFVGLNSQRIVLYNQ